ncbi:MAG TPA: SRPBCC domain-containing protein [Phycisphaerales bacterium]|nr:SRPBCC domain-containing protein [Phycisphaerales bacterium]
MTHPAPDPLKDSAARPQPGSISLEFDLAHSPTKVWRALTDPALLAEWLLPAVGLTLKPGAVFTFRAQPQPGAGWDGVVNCRFLEIEPQRKLSWSWVVGDIDTVVTFTLTPTIQVGGGEGTRLSVVQTGFRPDQKQAFGGASYGWKMMSGKLIDLLGRV